MAIVLIFLLIIFFIIRIFRNNSFSNKKYQTYKSSAEVLGEIGEDKVAQFLESLPQSYHIFNDIYLYSKGRTTQIDHIVVSIYGIFVIETKNYKGQIYGNDTSEYWSENFYGKMYKFYNPIRQNYYHIRALQEVLKISISNFISIIAFSEGAILKCKTSENIIYFFELKKFIESFQKPIFSEAKVEKIVDKLLHYNMSNEEMKKIHKKSVQEKVYQKKILISKKICPRCGGKLVERNGNYGNFLGCSNYPECKFTFKI